MRAFFTYAVNEDYILKNPCINSKIIIPKNKENGEFKIDIFTNEEISILRKDLEGHKLKCLLLLALGTRLRQGELLALRWSDIDQVTCEVTVNKSDKNVKIIASGAGNHIAVKNLFNSYKTLLIKAGIKHKKFHSLRHYVTKLFKKRVPLNTVQTLFGQSNISITAEICTHVMPKEKVTAA